MLDSLAVNVDEDTGDESDAITESNLSTPDGWNGVLMDQIDELLIKEHTFAPTICTSVCLLLRDCCGGTRTWVEYAERSDKDCQGSS
ncbi:hypothetical protein KIN20_010721 [Parelaphostrongylus tenuis]|uniref:Uncharacterized protein n=1 Tax=Parelaphostrongylus tenuis TaxID=148309 RepID=A0AAD5M8B1_PARTN|nr:hypothetical protein KIN20_010721 [Parelaphostrongylus tenuis]